jgi:hypothetical protein
MTARASARGGCTPRARASTCGILGLSRLTTFYPPYCFGEAALSIQRLADALHEAIR